MSITYEKLDSIRLAAIHAMQFGSRNNAHVNHATIVEADDYPKETKARQKVGKDEGGRTQWAPVMNWRGIDKAVARRYNHPRYSGAALRALRAIKGVGRPWVTLLNTTPNDGQSLEPSDNQSSLLSLPTT